MFWSDELQHSIINKRIEDRTNFPSWICFVNGILIGLEYKPTWKGKDFYSQKSYYSISVTIVCDDKKMIYHYYTERAGCSHDACIFANSQLGRTPGRFFLGDQYLF
ncbi:hypothetical protein PHYBLDRAFT_119732 [Phycomyces blakesleeanus NRRL 1555(-)]|uniref:DDE Tnp4 domain-containing protein n=1 Tax=Phycomyces blakesleeanus (strain ATCC 8743b / DSM 1359 / FGSC 10004 / NBRC 33097 / NRRL 1555) TaxID=763407 RepID=A0A162ZCA0_PHYB8|nr:hypothetical protein PHYBLDRAFT_119732 [Phycomyces blakesleeanus NRRL 1555(-)]OAD65801.1 hypothetical protein PHYBLDRAFT_119732 [Phycomyces blakesleeanus NRRL 1555(-)]|eukprot:XP_018283841.1 hypothetical protein PHYBLDRAFT_119732 [Phycomyces blakesleeanus NRRL 1555(-)]